MRSACEFFAYEQYIALLLAIMAIRMAIQGKDVNAIYQFMFNNAPSQDILRLAYSIILVVVQNIQKERIFVTERATRDGELL